MANCIFKAAKKVYKKLPFNYKTKDKMKAVFYTCFSFALKNSDSYKAWNVKNEKIVRIDKISIDENELSEYEFSGKIGIQLHLYYVDLADEFISYFSNIPYKFNLYISIIDKKDRQYVTERFSTIRNLDNLVIKVVENRGRDVAPLLVYFSDEIVKNDIMIHVHSKKSLYTGGEQSQWREYLLSSLFCDAKTFKQHLYIMDKGENVGIVYPETFYALPYTGHTWLKNAGSRDELLNLINVDYKESDIYFDYPMGTMFIAKVDALKQFFESGIKLDDFPKENGQVDGTLAHAFERCLTSVAKHNNYNLAIYNKSTNDYVYNNGLKNMNQYFIKSYEGLKNKAKDYDIVTFDIFDTLITRKVAKPEAVLALVDSNTRDIISGKFNYLEIRRKAEINARTKNYEKDINIDDIYKEFAKICGDNVLADKIKLVEINVEKSLVILNQKMNDVLEYIHNVLKKKVILVSDMHLTKNIIEEMLDDCGVTQYDELWVSCEINARKDNGKAFERLRDIYKTEKILHIGDNELSDVHIPMEYNIDNYHVMSKNSLFQNTNIGHCCKITGADTIVDSALVGLVLNKSFEDKFRYNADKFNVKINNFYELGYSFIAPTIMTYLLWLIDETKKNNAKDILFFAREGYLLDNAFKVIKENSSIANEIDGKYIAVSRRALSYAALKNKNDILELLQIYYLGTIKDLLANRFGIELADDRNMDIRLPGDDLKVMKILEPYIDDILSDAKIKREEYIKYYEKLRVTGKAVVSDIGYSGTIQYYLSKITGESYYGRYFATDATKRPLAVAGNDIVGLFSDGVANKHVSKSAIHRYDLLFESIMIAPVGQLLYVDNGKLIYTEENNPLFIDGIEAAHRGVLDFVKDYLNVVEIENINDIVPDKNIADGLIGALVENNCIGDEIAKVLLFEDKYCGNVKNNLMEEYFKKQA